MIDGGNCSALSGVQAPGRHLYLPDADVVVRVQKQAHRRHSFTHWCRTTFTSKQTLRRGSLLLVRPNTAKLPDPKVPPFDNSPLKLVDDISQANKLRSLKVSSNMNVFESTNDSTYATQYDSIGGYNVSVGFHSNLRYGSLRVPHPIHETPKRQCGEYSFTYINKIF